MDQKKKVDNVKTKRISFLKMKKTSLIKQKQIESPLAILQKKIQKVDQ